LGLPRAGWPGNYPSPKTLSFPKAKRLQVFPAPWLRAFFSPHDPGFPPRPSGSSFPFAEVAQSFLFAAWLGVSPLPVSSKFSLCRWLGGCPPLPGGAGLSLGQKASKLPFAGWPGVSPAPGGSEFPPRRWRWASPCPKARICPLPGGSGFPPYRWLGVSPSPVTVPVVGEFLRPSAEPHKGFRAAISRFFSRPQAIHS
jgi:hypothetical protein